MVIDPYGRPVNEYPYFSYSEMQFTLLLSPNEGKDDICSHPGEMSQDEIDRSKEYSVWFNPPAFEELN